MKKITTLLIGLLLLTVQSAAAAIDYRYMSSDKLITILKEKQPVYVVDIQKKNDYLRRHFRVSIGTNAYPVKTEQEKERIKQIISSLQKTSDPVVIVGPRGTRASQKAYNYLLDQGIAPQRLTILEKGMRGWPAPQMLLNTSGQ